MALGYLADQQADSPGFRLWEMAGTSHADDYVSVLGLTDNGSGTADQQGFNAMLDPPAGPAGFTCAVPVNTGEEHYVLDSAQYRLNQWVVTGQTPPQAPRLLVNESGSTPAFVLDANGNAVGGIRTPAVDVPVATLSGLGQSGASFCFLFGTTVPFSVTKLAALYPTHAAFIGRWAADTGVQVVKGFLRPADARLLIAAAINSSVGG
jgi:hypothetical protein